MYTERERERERERVRYRLTLNINSAIHKREIEIERKCGRDSPKYLTRVIDEFLVLSLSLSISISLLVR